MLGITETVNVDEIFVLFILVEFVQARESQKGEIQPSQEDRRAQYVSAKYYYTSKV